MATVFAPPAVVRPGDTIWLRGGTYPGGLRSNLTGTALAPIIVRPYLSERAIIDGANSNYPTLTVMGAHTWYWGFELTNTNPNRNNPTPTRPEGLNVFGVGTKIINMVLHDLGQGIGGWAVASNAELYGNIIYYNGFMSAVRASGHGMYVQNDAGTKLLADNIVFNNFGVGVHVYTSGAPLNNITVDGNVTFDNGSVGGPNARSTGILVGGGAISRTTRVINNMLYAPFSVKDGAALYPCYNDGCLDMTINNNYAVAGNYAVNSNGATIEITQATGNTLIGYIGDRIRPFIPAASNTLLSQPPTTNRVFVRPNRYETGRATIVVYNWQLAAEVSVDVAGVLTSGNTYEVRNVQDFFGAPVLTGTYTGQPLRLPMRFTPVTQIVGAPPALPTSSGPGFGTFVLRRTGTTSTPTPPPTTPPPSTPPPTTPPPTTPPPTTPPPPSTPASHVSILIEPESGSVVSPLQVLANSQASNGRYVTSFVPNAGTVTMPFTIPANTQGQYTVWARVLAPNWGSDSYFVSLDNGAEIIFDVAGVNEHSTAWRWRRLNARVGSQILAIDPMRLNLTSGQHTLRFRGREAATYFDRLFITNNPNALPPQ